MPNVIDKEMIRPDKISMYGEMNLKNNYNAANTVSIMIFALEVGTK